MTRTSPNEEEVRVIKKNQVMLAGSRRVGSGCASAAPASRRPTARIVEAGAGSAGIEVACSCGRVIYLQIDCGPEASGPPPAGATETAQDSPVSN